MKMVGKSDVNGLAGSFSGGGKPTNSPSEWGGTRPRTPTKRGGRSDAPGALESLAIVLLIVWVLGFASTYTLGGFIHFLPVLAISALLVRLVRGLRG